MIISGKPQQTYLEECAALISDMLHGVKEYALLPKKLTEGETVFLGNYYRYPIGIYFKKVSEVDGLPVYAMNRYEFGGFEDSGYATWTSQHPDYKWMCRIEVDGEILGSDASYKFLTTLQMSKQIENERPEFTMRRWGWD